MAIIFYTHQVIKKIFSLTNLITALIVVVSMPHFLYAMRPHFIEDASKMYTEGTAASSTDRLFDQPARKKEAEELYELLLSKQPYRDSHVGYIDLKSYAKEKKEKNNELRRAIGRNDIGAVRAALQSGAEVNYIDQPMEESFPGMEHYNHDITPLLFAINNGRNPEIIKELLEHGADNSFYLNRLALQDTVFPLEAAARNGDTAIVKLLLEHHAEVSVTNKFGNTALHQAVNHNHEEIARLLLDAGASLNAHNYEGMTPLMMASKEGNEPLVRMLIEVYGADKDMLNNTDKTAQEIARKKGYTALADLIPTLEYSGPLIKNAEFGRGGAAAHAE